MCRWVASLPCLHTEMMVDSPFSSSWPHPAPRCASSGRGLGLKSKGLPPPPAILLPLPHINTQLPSKSPAPTPPLPCMRASAAARQPHAPLNASGVHHPRADRIQTRQAGRAVHAARGGPHTTALQAAGTGVSPVRAPVCACQLGQSPAHSPAILCRVLVAHCGPSLAHAWQPALHGAGKGVGWGCCA